MSDRSPGILLAFGYTAGDALAGIFIAMATNMLTSFDETVIQWTHAHNPLYAYANLLSTLPFAVLVLLLYWVARKK